MRSACAGLKMATLMPPNKTADRAASALVEAAFITYDGQNRSCGAQAVAVETPVNIIYGSIPFAVMMTSPADLEDFAYGFSFTEGIINSAGEIRTISIGEVAGGLEVSVTLNGDIMQRHLGRARNLAGRTGCGVCGITDITQMHGGYPQLECSVPWDPAAIGTALRNVQSLQTLNEETRAVHGAAFCSWEGDVIALREDVGRHNALDKMIGAMVRSGTRAADGFVQITSRASYEMIDKTVRFGAPVLVAMSAPTSLAIERAKNFGLTLVAVARHDGAMNFTATDGFTGRDT